MLNKIQNAALFTRISMIELNDIKTIYKRTINSSKTSTYFKLELIYEINFTTEKKNIKKKHLLTDVQHSKKFWKINEGGRKMQQWWGLIMHSTFLSLHFSFMHSPSYIALHMMYFLSLHCTSLVMHFSWLVLPCIVLFPLNIRLRTREAKNKNQDFLFFGINVQTNA